ncbi:MAG: VIT1/CCC1 transporter family protein [Candidatus Nanohaloarchaea archaeon]|nr:VIT1/CCC1 transporter family protein [Candidatus Nanohaloarchaea archaeon]
MSGDMNDLAGGNIGDIARRYIVLNGFDGILTVLGITVGAFASSVSSPRILISSGMGAAIGLLVSGFSSAYFTEKAERAREFKELKEDMVSDMEGSIQEKRVSSRSLSVAFLNGISPFITAVISTSPYVFAYLGVVPMVNTAYYISASLALIMLGMFGAFLGKISRESILLFALKMIAVGLATVAITYFLGMGGL